MVVMTFFIRGHYDKEDFEEAGVFEGMQDARISVERIGNGTKMIVKHTFFLAISTCCYKLGAAGYNVYSNNLYFEKPEEEAIKGDEIPMRFRNFRRNKNESY